MRVVVITPPSPVVTMEQAKAHLRVDGTDDDALIMAYVAAATGHIDGPDGWLGRAIGEQVLEAFVDHLGDVAVCLPYPPIVSVEAVRYLDTAGVLQTLAPDRYELIGNSLVTGYRVAWPVTLDRREAARVRYRAGYAFEPEADEPVDAVPPAIRAAILLMVGDLWSQRETTAAQSAVVPMSTSVTNLLAPFRIWR